MTVISFFCKTYHRDFVRVKRLLQSIEQYNIDKIPFYISCPEKEYELLINTIGTDGYTFIPDEQICNLTPKFTGWKSQVPIKLNAYKFINSKNVLVIDSDAFFIKEFFISDFIAYNDIPYTLICENKHIAEQRKLLFDSSYINSEYALSARAYRSIFGGKSTKIYDYGPNPHLWSSYVLEHMNLNYLIPNNLDFQSFSNIFEENNKGIHARESLMYGEYLFATKCIDIVPAGPFFKVFHWQEQYELETKIGLVDMEKIKENYIGIVLQSNWSAE